MVSIVGTTLAQLATAINDELGAGQTFTNGPTNSIVTATSMNDSEAPAEKYGGWYLYCAADPNGPTPLTGQQQRIKRDGFDGTGASSGGTGASFTTAAAFTANAALGGTWLLCGALPVLDQDGLIGIRTCVNRALRKLWTIYRYPITSTGPTVDEYDLGALFWASRRRFRRLLDPDPSGTGHPSPSAVGWNVIANADTWTLQLGSGFPTGDVFYLEAEVPLNYRLYLSGAWAAQSSPTAGLVLPTDACLGEWNHVFQCSLYECMKQLAVQAGGNRKAYWEARLVEQRAVVAAIKAYQVEVLDESLGEGPQASPGSWATAWGTKGLFV